MSKSTFFRFFAAKEAVAIEAEVELWTAYLSALAERPFTGTVLAGLHDTPAAAATGLDATWDGQFLATRRLIAREPALLAYVQHYRASGGSGGCSALIKRFDDAVNAIPDSLSLK